MENASGKNAKSCSAFRTMFMNSQQLLTVENDNICIFDDNTFM